MALTLGIPMAHTASIESRRGSDVLLLTSVVLAVGAMLFVGVMEGSLLSTLTVSLLWGTVGTVLLVPEGIAGAFPNPLIRLFWVVFSLRIFVTAVLHMALSATPYAPWWDIGALGGDEVAFWTFSERLVWAWNDGTILREPEFTTAFAWLHLVAFVRFLGRQLGGETVFNARLVLCMASALIIPYVYALARRLFDRGVARVAAALAFWLPDYWFYSATLLKDVLVSCLMVIIFYQVVTVLYGRFRWWRLVLAGALNFGVMRYLRVDLMVLNTVLVIAFAMWSDVGRPASSVRRVLIVLTLVTASMAMLALVAPLRYTNRVLLADYIGHRVNLEREKALEEAGPESFGVKLIRLPLYLGAPLETLYLLVNPLPPWGAVYGRENMFPLKATIILISSFVWFGLLSFLPVGWMACLRTHARRTLWVWGTALVLAFGLGLTASGQPRWRLGLMPFLLIILAQGMLNWRRYPVLLGLTVVSLAWAVGMYSILKYLR